MKALILFVRRFYRQFIPPIPEKYQVDFKAHTLSENYNRLRLLAIIFFFWFLLLLICDISIMHDRFMMKGQPNFLWIDLFTILFLLTYFYFFKIKYFERETVSPIRKSMFTDFGIFMFLSIGTIIGTVESNMNPGMPTFIITIFLVGTTFIFSGLKVFIFLLFGLVLLFFMLFHQYPYNRVFLFQNAAYIALVFLAWINSQIIYRGRIKNYLKEKDLLEANAHLQTEMKIRIQTEKELTQAKETLEKRVEERTTDLRKTIRKLEREVKRRKKVEEHIRTSLEEKEVLLREIHHRVKNNLQIIQSLLNMQARSITDKKIKQLFEYSKNRIHTMAMVHEHLFQSKNLSAIKISEYLQKIATSFDYYLYDHKKMIRVNIEAEPVLISPDDAVFYGLILNELLTNGIQHAFPKNWKGEPLIDIQFNELPEKHHRLIVRDNGVGFQPDEKGDGKEHIGITLVQILAEKQLGGTFTMENDCGTKVIITIPPEDHH